MVETRPKLYAENAEFRAMLSILSVTEDVEFEYGQTLRIVCTKSEYISTCSSYIHSATDLSRNPKNMLVAS